VSRPNKRVKILKSNYMEKHDRAAQRQRLRKRRLIQRLVTIGIIFAIAFAVLVAYHVKQRTLYAEKVAERKELTTEMTELEKEEKALLEEIDLLNDEEYILDIARTNYFLSKEGELIFQIDEDEQRRY